MKKENVKIIVATHKKYQMPEEKMYLPVHVGAEGKENLEYQKDNEGKNISRKNPYFCELTGLYWAWKNLDVDYVGLVHYRRYFAGKNKDKDKFKEILTEKELRNYLNNYDIIVPKKRRYYIETLYNHYKHTMYVETLDKTKEAIEELYPDFMPAFNRLYKRRSAHMFNMLIMKKNIFDDYCKWLFDILFKLEQKFRN